MRNKITMLLSFFVILAVPILSFADEPKANPCSEEIGRFCKKVKGDPAKLTACLQQHSQNISVGCKEHMDETAEIQDIHTKMKNFRQTCRGDLATLCMNVPKGKGRQLKCLTSQSDKLSPTCKTTLENEGFLEAAKTQSPTAGTVSANTTTTGTNAPAANAPAAAPAAPGTTGAPASAPPAPITK